jgi:hypothetical protein
VAFDESSLVEPSVKDEDPDKSRVIKMESLEELPGKQSVAMLNEFAERKREKDAKTKEHQDKKGAPPESGRKSADAIVKTSDKNKL